MYTLGIDLGTSSVKVSLFDLIQGKEVGHMQYPEKEMRIDAQNEGWAEQNPETWWENTATALKRLQQRYPPEFLQVKAIGISYQMHGLVILDHNGKVIRPAIIWCDSRAVEVGVSMQNEFKNKPLSSQMLNPIGNFTAAKLQWVKQNEPDNFSAIHKVMLPGDYLSYKITNQIYTTKQGLSEGIFYDFGKKQLAEDLINQFDWPENLFPEVERSIGGNKKISTQVARDFGLMEEVLVTYKAGDQPNNAFSLNVLKPGEIATTAGTSAVIYAVVDQPICDQKGNINTFLHVNDSKTDIRNGILLCVNGAGILFSWLKNELFDEKYSYEQLNAMAESVAIGSNDLRVYPFGNGNERILDDKQNGAKFIGLNLVEHKKAHITRACLEGIVFAMVYGLEKMMQLGVKPKVFRAGKANLFLSKVFCDAFVNTTGVDLCLYQTDGAQGAARGAGLGLGYYTNTKEVFETLKRLETLKPNSGRTEIYKSKYESWKQTLSS
jgi:xylulokinase